MSLIGKDWKFRGFLSSVEDANAQNASLDATIARVDELDLNDGERNVHMYNCGFTRGSAWVRDQVFNLIEEGAVKDLTDLLLKLGYSIPPKRRKAYSFYDQQSETDRG